MEKTILTKRQQQLLDLFSADSYIRHNFCLSGGTALAEYYLHHRLSEDLDFFSFEEVEAKAIQIIFKRIKPLMRFEKVVYENSFNRNLFYIHFSNEVIKTEFTYYPFEQIEQPKKVGTLKVDSLIDIAVNKTDTLFNRARTRDFIDLYLIMQKEKWLFSDLKSKARIKFDTYVNTLHVVQQLVAVTKIKDYPRMIIPFDMKVCEQFWLDEAQKLKKEILK